MSYQFNWNKLTGANTIAIIDTVHNFMPPAKHPQLYGNGKAAEKIIKKLVKGHRQEVIKHGGIPGT